MTLKTCVFVLGTRAQLVKVAPVLRAAAEQDLPHIVWFTGQHQESIADLIDDFDLTSRFVMPAGHRERSSVRMLLGWAPMMLIACRRFIASQRLAKNRDQWCIPREVDDISSIFNTACD